MQQEIALNQEQQEAYSGIIDWAQALKPGVREERTLGGYAGTGKTTLIRAIVSGVVEGATLLAPTGKAAQVLRDKGLEANTIHSAVYSYQGQDEKGSPVFEPRPRGISEGVFVIVDEASMVNTDLAETLRSTGANILWVGDKGQLPPVGDDPGIMHKPDFMLRNIVRQAEGSPIIAAAHEVLSGTLEPKDLKDSHDKSLQVFKTGRWTQPEAVAGYAHENGIDQIICGFNDQRHSINRAYRTLLGYEEILEVGEKVICLLNNRTFGTANGEIYYVGGLEQGELRSCVRVKLCETPDLEDGFWAEVDVPTFGGNQEKNHRPHKRALRFDYAYAITCHKSQGSEWPSVLVVDASCKYWEDNRWRYTAMTRAAERLVFYV